MKVLTKSEQYDNLVQAIELLDYVQHEDIEALQDALRGVADDIWDEVPDIEKPT